MHGMINRAIQCFVRDTYGQSVWTDVADQAGLGFDNFEAMLSYPDQATLDVLHSAEEVLSKPRDALLEDIGTYLISHPNVEAIRRLMRFGGDDFTEFMFSLNELEGRARLSLPDLEMPQLHLFEGADGGHTLTCRHILPDFGHVMVGVMRAMADDFGALVFLEHQGANDTGAEVIQIQLLEVAFAQGRSFDLSLGAS